jgi:hypothetical protein
VRFQSPPRYRRDSLRLKFLRHGVRCASKTGLTFQFLKWLLGLEQNEPTKTTNITLGSAVNEGDFHSGPEGYSPNTAYPETQNVPAFEEAADWNEEER